MASRSLASPARRPPRGQRRTAVHAPSAFHDEAHPSSSASSARTRSGAFLMSPHSATRPALRNLSRPRLLSTRPISCLADRASRPTARCCCCARCLSCRSLPAPSGRHLGIERPGSAAHDRGRRQASSSSPRSPTSRRPSRWHDVFRSLRGQYGAPPRATTKRPPQRLMYVAAPPASPRPRPRVIGVRTSAAVQSFGIHRGRADDLQLGATSVVALRCCLILSVGWCAVLRHADYVRYLREQARSACPASAARRGASAPLRGDARRAGRRLPSPPLADYDARGQGRWLSAARDLLPSRFPMRPDPSSPTSRGRRAHPVLVADDGADPLESRIASSGRAGSPAPVSRCRRRARHGLARGIDLSRPAREPAREWRSFLSLARREPGPKRPTSRHRRRLRSPSVAAAQLRHRRTDQPGIPNLRARVSRVLSLRARDRELRAPGLGCPSQGIASCTAGRIS